MVRAALEDHQGASRSSLGSVAQGVVFPGRELYLRVMDEAAPTAGATAEKMRRLLRRVPTSLIVTLLGIALTAWLLPAFTRQLDDKQKAHALTSALVADMASATAHALTGGAAIWAGRPVDKAKIADAWSLESMQIEARLDAYFEQRVVTAWQVYSWFVDRFVDGYRAEAWTNLIEAAENGFPLEPEAADLLGLVYATGRYGSVGAKLTFAPRIRSARSDEFRALGELRKKLRPSLEFYKNRYVPLPRIIEGLLFRVDQEIAREVLAAHVNGYSTTTHDLVHDLIPGLG
jgi:hypothetical protein